MLFYTHTISIPSSFNREVVHSLSRVGLEDINIQRYETIIYFWSTPSVIRIWNKIYLQEERSDNLSEIQCRFNFQKTTCEIRVIMVLVCGASLLRIHTSFISVSTTISRLGSSIQTCICTKVIICFLPWEEGGCEGRRFLSTKNMCKGFSTPYTRPLIIFYVL